MLESLGPYKILDPVGSGGLGELFRARDTHRGRTVALRVVSHTIAADAAHREQFLHDAQAAATLSHPNIAALYEVGEDQNHLYLASEFVQGETLEATIGGRPLNPRQAAEYAIQIADALAEAHANGIVHGNVKPTTIMVTAKRSAKILDFGLASWTRGGALPYMAPEQLQRRPIDQRADIFSLGAVLFEMLTGRPPVSGMMAPAVAMDLLHTPAPLVSSLNWNLQTDFDALVAKALAKNPKDRYEAAATMAAELRGIAAMLDVRTGNAEPPTIVPRTNARPALPWVPIVLGAFALAFLIALIALWILRK
jgi:serine/threonine protein kinase